jgi:hypothetical protein
LRIICKQEKMMMMFIGEILVKMLKVKETTGA